MKESHLPEYIKFLLNKRNYPYHVQDVHLIQTHISYVLIAGDLVYKWKKKVDFGFLDFSTVEKRKVICEREIVLNRRLCPDIYLGLVTINRCGSDSFELNGDGEVVDYGVKMVRMDDRMMMSLVIARNELTQAHLNAIIEQLVPFYENADGEEPIQKYGEAKSIGVNVLENFDQTRSFIGTQGLSRSRFEVIRSYAESFLDNEECFKKRITAGRIRDCHGDLHSGNICLDKTVHIFDCIEFNQRFRYIDVAADVGFLAMDLDYHALFDLSSYFVNRFIDQSGDAGLGVVLDFYKCYRAYVRGKIGLFTAADPAVDKQTAKNCQVQAVRYLKLAEKYAGGGSS